MSDESVSICVNAYFTLQLCSTNSASSLKTLATYAPEYLLSDPHQDPTQWGFPVHVSCSTNSDVSVNICENAYFKLQLCTTYRA